MLLAGRGGARLLQIVKAPLSRTSVLFHVMRLPLPSPAAPRVLGVDDFALYADTYGTLLVDAESRLPIELWAGRDAGQLAVWLRRHPGVEVVCWDSSLVYRQGITDGAPHAVQVSNRFHPRPPALARALADTRVASRSLPSGAYPGSISVSVFMGSWPWCGCAARSGGTVGRCVPHCSCARQAPPSWRAQPCRGALLFAEQRGGSALTACTRGASRCLGWMLVNVGAVKGRWS